MLHSYKMSHIQLTYIFTHSGDIMTQANTSRLLLINYKEKRLMTSSCQQTNTSNLPFTQTSLSFVYQGIKGTKINTKFSNGVSYPRKAPGQQDKRNQLENGQQLQLPRPAMLMFVLQQQTRQMSFLQTKQRSFLVMMSLVSTPRALSQYIKGSGRSMKSFSLHLFLSKCFCAEAQGQRLNNLSSYCSVEEGKY